MPETAVFSTRFKSILQEVGFLEEFSHELKMKLISTLTEFNEPQAVTTSRYGGYIRNTTAWVLVFEALFQLEGYQIEYAQDVDDEWVYKQDTSSWMDILELWCRQLSNAESIAFQSAANHVLEDENSPWRLVGGLMYKIDQLQFNQGLHNKALAMLEGSREYVPIFQNAFDEYQSALQYFESRDYSNTILCAAKSFESVLKVATDKNEGQADKLSSGFMSGKLAEDIPALLKNGFKDNVLMSLPYIRNKLLVGHGRGSQDIVIPKAVAGLALDLAASLNTFIVSQYQGQVPEFAVEDKATMVPIDDDDLPF